MQRLPLFALCLGFFMIIMDATIVNVALPSIATGLNASISWLQWIIDGYTLMFACLLLLAGHLSDQFGAKKLFLLGIAIFSLASFSCGIANSAWLLTVFRFMQGSAAAFILPTSLALIHNSFHEQKTRAKAIGIWATTGGIAAASGPMLGGILMAVANWRAVFFVNVPIGLLCFFITLTCLPETKRQPTTQLDGYGQCLGIITIAALAFALIEAGRNGWGTTSVVIAASIFLVSLCAFILTEMRVKYPMLPLHFFKRRAFTMAVLVGVMMNIGFYGEMFILPLYFQHIRAYSALQTGFALLPMLSTIAISSYLSGNWVSKSGPKWPIIVGLTLDAVGFFSLLIIGQDSPSYWVLVLPLIIIGFGLALAMPAATVAIMQTVDAKRSGLASGTFNTCRQLGSLIGVALFGSIVASNLHFVNGMHITLVIAALVSLSAATLTFFLLRSESILLSLGNAKGKNTQIN